MMYDGHIGDVICLGVAKALDCIINRLLFAKPRSFGPEEIVVLCIEAYLIGRDS